MKEEKIKQEDPELFWVNRKALRDLEVNLDYGRKQLRIIADEYLKAVGSLPTMEEIASWFGSSKNNFLVANTDTIRSGIVSKLYVEQRKLYPKLQFGTDNVMLNDLEPLFAACSQLIFIPEVNNKESMFWHCYSIEAGKIILIPEAVELEKQRWRVYAVTEEEKARLAAIRKLCSAMDGIKLTNPAQLNILGFVAYDETGVYSPQESYIKGYIK